MRLLLGIPAIFGVIILVLGASEFSSDGLALALIGFGFCGIYITISIAGLALSYNHSRLTIAGLIGLTISLAATIAGFALRQYY